MEVGCGWQRGQGGGEGPVEAGKLHPAPGAREVSAQAWTVSCSSSLGSACAAGLPSLVPCLHLLLALSPPSWLSLPGAWPGALPVHKQRGLLLLAKKHSEHLAGQRNHFCGLNLALCPTPAPNAQCWDCWDVCDIQSLCSVSESVSGLWCVASQVSLTGGNEERSNPLQRASLSLLGMRGRVVFKRQC